MGRRARGRCGSSAPITLVFSAIFRSGLQSAASPTRGCRPAGGRGDPVPRLHPVPRRSGARGPVLLFHPAGASLRRRCAYATAPDGARGAGARRPRHRAAPLVSARRLWRLRPRHGDRRVRRADDRAALVRGDGRLRQPPARAALRQQPRAAPGVRPHRRARHPRRAYRGVQPALPDRHAGARALARRARCTSRSRSAWRDLDHFKTDQRHARPRRRRLGAQALRRARAARPAPASIPSGVSAARSSCWCCPAPDRQGALAVAERVRAPPRRACCPSCRSSARITISIGVATYVPGEEVGALLAERGQGPVPGQKCRAQ